MSKPKLLHLKVLSRHKDFEKFEVSLNEKFDVCILYFLMDGFRLIKSDNDHWGQYISDGINKLKFISGLVEQSDYIIFSDLINVKHLFKSEEFTFFFEIVNILGKNNAMLKYKVLTNPAIHPYKRRDFTVELQNSWRTVTTNLDQLIKSTQIKVFISYSHLNKEIVNRIVQKIEGFKHFDVWIDEKNILAGQRWEEVIHKNINQHDKIIVFLSSIGYYRKGYFNKEIKLILETQKMYPNSYNFVIPILLDNIKIPPDFEIFHCLKFTSLDDDFLLKLQNSLSIRID